VRSPRSTAGGAGGSQLAVFMTWRACRPTRNPGPHRGHISPEDRGQQRTVAVGQRPCSAAPFGQHHSSSDPRVLSRTEEPSSRLAGGRLRWPSWRRQRHDRHRGIGLTLTSGAAEHVPAQILLALSRRGRPRLRERVRRTGREHFPSASVWCRETTWLRSLTGQRATQFSCRAHESGPPSRPPV
jgi:hypothetical protein